MLTKLLTRRAPTPPEDAEAASQAAKARSELATRNLELFLHFHGDSFLPAEGAVVLAPASRELQAVVEAATPPPDPTQLAVREACRALQQARHRRAHAGILARRRCQDQLDAADSAVQCAVEAAGGFHRMLDAQASDIRDKQARLAASVARTNQTGAIDEHLLGELQDHVLALAGRGRFDAAVAALELLAAHGEAPPTMQHYVQVAECLISARKPALAAALMARCPQPRFPSEDVILQARARAQALNWAGDFIGALEALGGLHGGGAGAKDFSCKEAAVAYDGLARQARAAGHDATCWEGACNNALDTVHIRCNALDAADVYFQMGRLQEGLDRLASITPDYPVFISAAVPKYLQHWCARFPDFSEQILASPVWTIAPFSRLNTAQTCRALRRLDIPDFVPEMREDLRPRHEFLSVAQLAAELAASASGVQSP